MNQMLIDLIKYLYNIYMIYANRIWKKKWLSIRRIISMSHQRSSRAISKVVQIYSPAYDRRILVFFICICILYHHMCWNYYIHRTLYTHSKLNSKTVPVLEFLWVSWPALLYFLLIFYLPRCTLPEFPSVSSLVSLPFLSCCHHNNKDLLRVGVPWI